MNFKKLLLSTTAIFAATTSAAHAEPITIALFGAAFASTIAGQVVSIGFGLAFTYGLSLLQKAKTPDASAQTGTQLQIQMGDDQPISFIGGKFATSGRRKYIGAWGEDGKTPNAYLTDVIEIGNIPSYAGPLGLTSVWLDDQLCGVLWDQPHPDGRGYPVVQYRDSKGNDYCWIRYLDGTQTGADPFLQSKFGADPDRPWTGDMIGLGCQAVVLTARYNTDLFTDIPQGMYEPHPVRFYDVRKDSTNGGNGSHRWDDQSTWERTQNPAVMIYNIIRGVYFNGTWVYGGQNLAAYRLPPSNWMAAANACDVPVTLDDGTTEPAYQTGYEFHGDEKPADAIEKLRSACNGRLAEVGGIFKLLVGAPGGAVYAFTDDDVVVTEGQSYDPFPSLDDTVNAIEATYPEPSEKWASKDAPGRYSDDLEAEDGNRRLPESVTFDAVPFSNQVQRLMAAMVQEERRFRVHQFYLPPDAYPLEPNDVVSWSSARNGYSNKKFLVTTITGQRSFSQLVLLKEIDPSDYDWDSSMQLPTATGWLGPITAPSQPMYGWSVEPATIKDPGGIDRRPAIQISCAPDQDDVYGVWVQVRLKDSEDVVFDSDSNRYASPYSWIISGQWMLSNTDYEARGRYLPNSNRSTNWSDWLPVKTPNVLIQSGDVLDGAIIASKIADAAVTAEKIMDEAVTNLKLADAAVSTAKLQVAAVTAQVLADQAVISSKLADAAVTAAKLASQAIDATKFASGIEPVGIATDASLPTTKSTTTIVWNGKLYRWDGTAYVATVESTDVTGQIVSSQISDGAVVASKLADGSVSASKLAAEAIDATKLANSIKAVEIADTLPTTDNVEGRMVFLTTDGKLYRYHDDAWTVAVASTDVTGQLGASQIADGAIGDQQLADAAVIASKLADGSVSASKLADQAIDATKLADSIRAIEIVDALPTTGNTEGRMVYLTTDGKLYRYTGSAFTAASDAADMTGQIANTQISDGAISAPKLAANSVTATAIAAGAITAGAIAANAVTAGTIAAGAVTATQIAAGAITASKLTIADTTNYILNPSFDGGTSDGWIFNKPANNVVVAASSLSSTNTPAAFALTMLNDGTGTSIGYGGLPFALTVGETYFYEAWVSAPASGTSNYRLGMSFTDSAGAHETFAISTVLSIGVAPVIWTRVTGQVVVPATLSGGGAPTKGRFFAVITSGTGTWGITNVRLRKSITSELIVDGAITAQKVAANAISAVNIAANSITADKLVLGDFTNRVESPNFDNPTSWIKNSGAAIFTSAPNAYVGNFYAQIQSPAVGAALASVVLFPVLPGEEYLLQTFARSITTANTNLNARINFLAADKLTSVSAPSVQIPTSVGPTYTAFSVSAVVPAGAVYARVDFAPDAQMTTGGYQIGFVSCQRKNAGSLIVDGAITATKIAANAVTAGSIAANAVTAGTVAANAVTAGTIAANAVTTGTIAAGAVTATQIAAGTITADKMVLGDFTNRVENPNFGQGDVSWTKSTGATIVNDSANSYIGNFYMSVGAAGFAGIVSRNNNIFPVAPGETYFLQAFAKAFGGTNANIQVRIRYLAADKTTLIGTLAVTYTPADTTYVERNVVGTVPAGAVFAWVDVVTISGITTGAYAVGFISVQRQNSANLIVDGAITATKIAANAVAAANIAAGAITTDKLAVGSGGNFLPNSDFSAALANWSSEYSNSASSFAVSYRTDTYAPTGGAMQIYCSNNTQGIEYGVAPTIATVNSTGFTLGQVARYPCVAGQWFEFSGYYLGLNSNGLQPYMGFFDRNGAAISYPNAGILPAAQNIDPQFNLANYQKFWFKAQAPANAVTCVPFVRHKGTQASQANSYIFLTRLYFGEANANQTQPTPWSPQGITMVSGGNIITGAITADKIAANTITATQIAANTITAAQIAADTITAAQIAAGAISASEIAADAITAAKLASNSVTTDALAVGSGKNLLQNAGFTMGMDCWAISFNSGPIPSPVFRIRAVTETWAGPNCPTLMLSFGAPSGNNYYSDVQWLRPDAPTLPNSLKYGVPCAPGDWFEVSAYVSAHRCLVELRLQWIGSDGLAVGYTTANQVNNIPGSSTNPDTWTRLRCVGAAPANAVAVGIHIRKYETIAGQTDSYMFINKPMLCRCPANASEFTPWSDGGVVMITNGGIVADSITADKIATNAVTADAIAANAVTAGKIAAGAVTATTISAGTITGDKLAANTIGATQIAADAITAKQLVLTDFSNMADNGWQTGSIAGWTTQNQQNFYLDNGQGDASGYLLQSLGRDCAVSNFVAVSPGETYAFDVWVLNTDANTANVVAVARSPSGAVSFVGIVGTNTKSAWVRLQGKYTIPSGITGLAMDLQVNRTAGTGGSCYWSRPVMRRAVSAELIVDGAVTANKISVNSLDALTANLGAVNISSAVIGSLQVGTSNIQGGACTDTGVGRVAGIQNVSSNGNPVNLVACSVNVAGDGRVVVDCMAIAQINKNGGAQNSQAVGLNIFRDGLLIFQQVYYLPVVRTVVSGASGNGTASSETYTAGCIGISGFYDAPGAGSHVYTMQINNPGNTIGWAESNIAASSYKR